MGMDLFGVDSFMSFEDLDYRHQVGTGNVRVTANLDHPPGH